MGAYHLDHLAKEIRKFRLKVKWNSDFPENPFGDCRLPPMVVLFYCSFSVRIGTADISLLFAKLSSFHYLISRKQLREIELQMVSAISFGWFAGFVTIGLFSGKHPVTHQ